MFGEEVGLGAGSQLKRVHHPPDNIIEGKPKWSELRLAGGTAVDIDRLNPSRKLLVPGIQNHWDTQVGPDTLLRR